MSRLKQLRQLIPAFKALTGEKSTLAGLIKSNIASTKLRLSKFDLFTVSLVFKLLRYNDQELKQAFSHFFSLKGQPPLSQVLEPRTPLPFTSDLFFFDAVTEALKLGNIRDPTSRKLAESLALDRLYRPPENTEEQKYLGLSLYLEFCLRMMDVKFFERLRAMLD